MENKNKFAQMAILSAGTFANVLTAILFYGILILFFSLMFTPAGVVFNNYASAIVPLSEIDSVNGIALIDKNYEELASLINKEGFNDIKVGKENYVGVAGLSSDENLIYLYYDAPAINSKLQGAILEINSVKVTNRDELRIELEKYSEGDKIFIKTKSDEVLEYEIVLGKNPYADSSFLGIVFNEQSGSGIIGKFSSLIGSFKDSNVYYEPKFDGWSEFIYKLLWWLVLISFSVALVNMLPVGIFDGGRFFYLTILGITKSKKIAEKSFAFVTYLFLFLLLLVMIIWVKGIFF
jgi:membrane-associated protease RseP (regulator of RpoE activity)